MREKKLSGPKIPEPSDADVEATIERVKNKYGKVIRRDDAIILAKLYAELEWWFLVDKFSREPKSISVESVEEVRGYLTKKIGKDLTIEEARAQTRNILAKTIVVEKERIARVIKDIIEGY